MRDFPEDGVFFRVPRKPCFVTSSRFVTGIYCFFWQNKNTTLIAENGENLITAQPRISAHLK